MGTKRRLVSLAVACGLSRSAAAETFFRPRVLVGGGRRRRTDRGGAGDGDGPSDLRHRQVMCGPLDTSRRGPVAFLRPPDASPSSELRQRAPTRQLLRRMPPQTAARVHDISHRSSTSLRMSLIPIPVEELRSILPTPSNLTPSGDQYVAYLGRTPRQRFNSLFEGASIAFLGSMFAYFVSFVVGQFLATLLGVVFLFWPILSPEFKAYQRNWELVGGRDLVDVWMDDDDDDGYWSGVPEDRRGLYGAYYVAKIEDVCVVDDVRATGDEEYDLDEFEGYTMATDELEGVTGLPWKLRLRLLDDEGRGMQVHSRMSEEYLGIGPGMDAVGVLLSASRGFGELAGMTDFCVLDGVDGAAVAWVGDYPYLDKGEFLRTLGENGVADGLLDGFDDGDDGEDEDDDHDYAYESGDEGEEKETEEEYINVR